jgi:diketogulonate reductase-like aldo/keto reductase
VALAEKYNVSVQTICLSFACQCGVIPLPKSTDPGRIKQNLALVRLDENDIEKILAMPQTGWSGHDPDVAPEKDVQVPD